MGNHRVFAQADVAHSLRGWQDYHMDTRGWSDIAYQVAVDQAGRIWTLRGLTTRSGANGDAAANLAYGAILLVLGTGETPTGALINSTRQVISDFRRLYPQATAIKPHSWVRTHYTGSGTDCPGDPARALIAAGQFEPKATTPPPPPGEVSEMNQADRDYVDGRMSAYALWLNYRRLSDEFAVASARKDTVATGVLSPLVNAARTDWEKAAK
jgi:hypothetical protein